jgi:DNA-binding NarL/FixJ family response regulator
VSSLKPDTPKLRIVLVDDHGVVRDGLKRLIDSEPDMNVVGEAADGRQAIELTIASMPDIVVMDVSLGVISGAQATREIRKRCTKTRVLALTVHEDRSYIQEMLRAGACGYLVKRAAGDELIDAIRSVASKGVYMDQRIAGKLIAGFGASRPANSDPKTELSEREAEVMRLVAQGFTNKEIATKLGVSVKTIETYKARSMGKLGLRSRVDIVRMATDRGWFNGS